MLQKIVSEKFFLSDAQALTTKMDIEITRPRTVVRQTHRDDVTATSTGFFRQTIYIPFLENITSDLEGRFGDL